MVKPTEPVKRAKWRVLPFIGGKRDGESYWVDVSKDQIIIGITKDADFIRQSKEVYRIEDEMRAVYKSRRLYTFLGTTKK